MKVTFLGTGNAHAIDLYNTCFAFTEGEEHFLVDAGGGNGTWLFHEAFCLYDERDIFSRNLFIPEDLVVLEL